MMDLVSEVILSSEEVELEALNKKISSLFSDIEVVKFQVSKDFERKYVDYFPLDNKLHCEEITTLKASLEKCDENLKALMKKSLMKLGSKLGQLSDDVISNLGLSRLLESCIRIDSLLNSASELCYSENYFDAALHVYEAGQLLENYEDCKEFIEIFDGLDEQRASFQNTVVLKAEEKWNELVNWEEITFEKKGKLIRLAISKKEDKINEAYKILSMFKPELTPQAYNFANKMMKEFLKPIIMYSSTIQTQENTESVVFSVDYKVKSGKSSGKNDLSTALHNISSLLDFIKSNLKIESHSGVQFLGTVGSVISSEMIALLIDELVNDLIPLKRKDLEKLVPVSERLRNFDNELLVFGFLSTSSEQLQEYFGNPEEILKKKMAPLYLSEAKELMKKDLHDAIPYGPLNSYNSSDNRKYDGSSFLVDPEDSCKWIFPKCQISKWMLDLVSLIRDCLNEAIKSDYSYSLTLINTARTLFTVFCTVVPRLHRQLLDNIPQQSGFLYNNAMFLSYSILIMEKELRSEYPAEVQSHQISMVDYVHQLISMGTEELNHQISLQNNFLISILDTSGLKELSDTEVLSTSIKNGIRQGMRQLMLLNNVWSNVLPSQVYASAVGQLCDNFIEHLINLIVAAQDIPENVANQLVTVIDVIEEKAPQLFEEPKEVHRNVSSWMKLGELKRILAGTLSDIVDRWAGGKGPLAMEFKPNQVQHLIKALFSTSTRREQTLALIN